MNISFVEIEMKVRCVDQRNVPINETTQIITGDPEAVMLRIGKLLGSSLSKIVYNQIKEARDKPTPYED